MRMQLVCMTFPFCNLCHIPFAFTQALSELGFLSIFTFTRDLALDNSVLWGCSGLPLTFSIGCGNIRPALEQQIWVKILSCPLWSCNISILIVNIIQDQSPQLTPWPLFCLIICGIKVQNDQQWKHCFFPLSKLLYPQSQISRVPSHGDKKQLFGKSFHLILKGAIPLPPHRFHTCH